MKCTDFRIYEWLFYAILWGWTWAFPVLNASLAAARSGTDFPWERIIPAWSGILPFFILFLLHHLIVCRMLLNHRLRAYVVSVLCLLCLFGAFRYVRMDKFRDAIIATEHKGRPLGMRPDNAGGAVKPSDKRDDGIGPADRTDSLRPSDGPALRRGLSGRRPPRHLGHMSGGLPEPLMFDLGIAVLMLGFDVAIVLLMRYQQEQERARRQETVHLQHELESLKAQIRPHFFMNMLNNIHGMVEINPALAQEMIMEMSRLMRYVLYEGGHHYTTLRAETEFIANYVALMRKRYSNTKVAVSLRLPDPLPREDIMLPPLLFIVIIENAFKHGISYRKPSFLDMSMDVGDGRIRFDCMNSRSDRNDMPEEHGIGLANLRKRLRLLYGDDFTLSIDEQPDTYTISLTIPYKYKNDENNDMSGDR